MGIRVLEHRRYYIVASTPRPRARAAKGYNTACVAEAEPFATRQAAEFALFGLPGSWDIVCCTRSELRCLIEVPENGH